MTCLKRTVTLFIRNFKPVNTQGEFYKFFTERILECAEFGIERLRSSLCGLHLGIA